MDREYFPRTEGLFTDKEETPEPRQTHMSHRRVLSLGAVSMGDIVPIFDAQSVVGAG